MNFYALSSLMATITLLAMGIFMFVNGKSRLEIRIWGYICIGVIFWQIGSFGFSTVASKEMAFYWWQFAHIGVMLVPPIFFHFTCIYLKINRKRLIIAAYVFSVIFIIINFCYGRYFIGELRLTPDHFYWLDWPHSHNVLLIIYYIISYALLLGYSYFMLLNAFRHSRGIQRKQLQYLIVGTAVAWSGPIGIIISYFGLNLYTYTNILMGLFPIIMGYAIVRHQLMDIEVIIKKTLVFTGLFAASLAIFALPILLIQEFMLSRMGFGKRILSLSISAFLIILTLEPLKNFLIRITDKYLFQKKYNYQQILRSFIDKVITVPDADKIVDGTTELISNTLRPEKMAMFLFEKKIRKFVLRKNVGYDEHLDSDNLPNIISYLLTSRNILSIEHENNKGVANAIIDEMKPIGIHIAVPLISSNELLGIIILGKKKSDELYTTEDLNALMDLARTEAIAIKNSMVIQELTEEKKIAALGKVASSLSHNINNHLNRARMRIQEAIYTEGILDKLKEADNAEERGKLVEKLAEHLNRAVDYIDAGADVVKKARDFAKPSKGPPSPVNIKTPLEKAIFMVRELKLKAGTRQIPIAVDIAQDVPMVKAKEDDLREVMITVFDNAVDSIRMKELKGLGDNADNILIKASYVKKLKEVELRVIDTGVGIKKEDLDDIFLRYFTTKGSAALYEDYAKRKDVRVKIEKNNGVYGTGLGLDLVKSLVEEQIKGTIRSESAGENKGATFIITIPEWLEDKDGKNISS